MTQLLSPADVDFSEICVGGVFGPGSGGTARSIDPTDGTLVADYGIAGLDNVEDAVAMGQAAMADPAWRNLKAHERARVLYRIGDMIGAHADAIAALQTRDTGKTLIETRALAMSAAGTFRYVASTLETLDEDLTPSRGPWVTMSVHEPLGVVAAITPWNSPIASDAQKVAPALAAGNAVILKPAEWTPLVSLFFARLAYRAGLPKGLLSVLPGPGRVIGDALVRHPLVKKVSFTGGTVTGVRIAEIAASKLMPVSLELGGKSPTIVFPDADIEEAIAGVLYGVFSSTGQSCIAGSRLFVHESIREEFVSRLVERSKALRMGRGDAPGTQMAPMIHHRHRDHVAAMVDAAVAAGARVLCGGEVPQGEFAEGAWYPPTILDTVTNTDTICREEVFGPVLAVLSWRDEEDLVAQANDNEYGLACGIWTRDYKAAWRIARRIEAGTVWINTYKQFSSSTPFGGVKDSGLGREKGRHWIQAYMNQKAIYWGMSEEPIGWG
ncbi:aldehyde dehydrogenase (plasmid) [Novosphingobium resinovorum]|uniref:aldehyde dehydrogenase n=1 Tax=Novosphingobium TaxID=165696 RepID=UPI001B3C5516|nr:MULTISPECIES: aldehyde dehydrogenase [Novosphingobium]MBF7015166.1 aldehyde dehydrogenase [Novosphingobium sp. HR1a]WJM29846.1 aldehyde dehydrogenase [Novosphingobium resinovorum]